MASPPPQEPNPKPTLLPSPFPATTSPPPPTTTDNPPHPPTPFTPFFTLITDPTETTHHHPTVHYIFSSDPDPDTLITTAALQALSPPPSSPSPSNPTRAQPQKHRHVLLDLAPCGTKILRAQSLSPDWAVTSAEVRAAPTWGEGEGEGGGGMMVRVEGVERGGVRDGGLGKGGGDGGEEEKEEEEGESLEGLVERFERGLGLLRRVVGGV